MNKSILFFALISIAAAGCGTESGGTTEDPCSKPEEIFHCDGVLNIAHQGGKKVRPEHTMIAYEQALEDGADVLELDVHSTKDGVLVIMHDDTVDDTTDGTGAIKDMTYAEIQELDAAYRFTTDGGETFPYRGMGHGVPTLQEVFEAYPNEPYVIEIKQETPSIIDPFVAMVEKHGILDQMVGAGFDYATVLALRAAAPDMDTSMSEEEATTFFVESAQDELSPSYVPPADFLQVPTERGGIQVLHDNFVPTAHALGIKVHIWTINDAEEMRTLIEDFDVDGIITDDVATLTQVIAETTAE